MPKYALWVEDGRDGDSRFHGFCQTSDERQAEDQAYEIMRGHCYCEEEYDEEEDEYIEAECQCSAWAVEVADDVVAYDEYDEKYLTEEQVKQKRIREIERIYESKLGLIQDYKKKIAVLEKVAHQCAIELSEFGIEKEELPKANFLGVYFDRDLKYSRVIEATNRHSAIKIFEEYILKTEGWSTFDHENFRVYSFDNIEILK